MPKNAINKTEKGAFAGIRFTAIGPLSPNGRAPRGIKYVPTFMGRGMCECISLHTTLVCSRHGTRGWPTFLRAGGNPIT